MNGTRCQCTCQYTRVLDLFAGAGGWDEGARLAGHHGDLVGVDHDLPACRTATTAGHTRIQADVADLDPGRFVRDSLGWPAVTGLIASPPCQAWSAAGKRGGERDRGHCHSLVDAFAGGLPAPGVRWADVRSALVAEPVRWVRVLRPRWVALEQVPPVLPLWRHIAHVLRGWGYRAWCGVLAAEAFGVPQTRRRAILIASLDGPVGKPAPTHQEYRAGREAVTEPDLFGDPLPPPVSLGAALGWDVDRPARTVAGNRAPRWAYGPGRSYDTGWTLANGRQPNATRRADTEPARGASWVLRNNNTAHACVRHVGEPAGTLYFGERANAVDWVVDVGQDSQLSGGRTERYTRPIDQPSPTIVQPQRWKVRPATTVGGDRAGTDAVRVTVAEAAILQGFRADYTWRGTKTQQYRQVGDAVPPPLAAAILAPLLAAETRGAA